MSTAAAATSSALEPYAGVMPADAAPAPGTRRARIASGAIRAVCVFAAVVVLAVVSAFIVLTIDWVPFNDYNVTSTDWFLGFLVSQWALAITGLAWLIAVVAAWRKRHLRTRWLVVPPALLAIGVLIVVVIGIVLPAGFDTSRAELDAVVNQTRLHPPGWSENYHYDPRQVGNLEVWSVSHREDGVVVVSDADSGLFFRMSGWAHSPQGPPTFEPGVKELEVNHLEGPWYSYHYVL